MNCAKRRAWQRVAQEEGLPLPGGHAELVYSKIYDMRLERAVTEVCAHTCCCHLPCLKSILCPGCLRNVLHEERE